MVVNRDDGCCGVADGQAKHLAGVDKRGVECPDGDLMGRDDVVLGVEGYDMKLFLQAVGGKPREVPLAELARLFGGPNDGGVGLGLFGFGNSSPKFDGGSSLNASSIA